MNEQYYEKLLNIRTCGEQKVLNESLHYHRYEPTSYSALNTLFSEYTLDNFDSIVDFGCGKGRLNFYIHHFFKSYVTGIEMNHYYYNLSIENKNNYLKHEKLHDDGKIKFLNCMAQDYKIKNADNKFYFFNPFSVQIFISVVNNILDSVDENLRIIDIILYYPSHDYINYLENNTLFSLYKEVFVFPEYSNDYRNKFVIYRLNYDAL
ncbi:MAG: SAM-dependent methyltransferase [Clostridium sp.]